MALNYTLLAETPAGTPPPGITANFSDPYSLGYYNVITSAICVSVSTIVLWAKLYTKVFVSRNQGWEDCKSPHLA
jgi:type IV secretory pathway protease TraF